MYLVISPRELLVQMYNKLTFHFIKVIGFLYQQKYQHANPLISLFLHFENQKMK